jgi:hypothetical protein
VRLDTGAPIIRPFPTAQKDQLPSVSVVDDVTLDAVAPGGFDLAVVQPLPLADDGVRYSPGGSRVLRMPPFGPDGIVRIDGATIRVVERDGAGITKLRATFDAPLSGSTVLLLDGCKDARILPTGR